MDNGNNNIALFIKNKTLYTQQIIRNTIIAIVVIIPKNYLVIAIQN